MKKVCKETQEKVFLNLKNLCYGEDKGMRAVTATFWCLKQGDQRELRRICSAINSNPEINGIISTSGSIYVCNTASECRKAIKNTYRTAFTYLKKARVMEKKANLNGQYEFTDENGKKIKIIYED